MLVYLLPVFISILLGYVFNKTGFVKKEMFDQVKKIIINVCLPALLLSSLMNMKFKTEYLWVFVSVFASCLLLLVIGYGMKGIFKIKSSYFPFLITGFEAGMLGYALYTSIYGSAATFAVVDVGQVLFVFIILVPMIISANNDDVLQDKNMFKNSMNMAIKSPIIWSIVLGVFISILAKDGMYSTEVFKSINSTLLFISAPTTFFICLLIGSGLKFTFAGMKEEIITCVVRLALCLGLAFLIKAVVLVPLGLVDELWIALLFLFVLPGPFAIPVFMKGPSEADKAYVSNTLSIGTLLSLITITIIMIFV